MCLEGFSRYLGQGEIEPARKHDAIKTYRGLGGIVPHIPHLGISRQSLYQLGLGSQ
jgi:hypothetical protein